MPTDDGHSRAGLTAGCCVDGRPLAGRWVQMADGARCLRHALVHGPTVARSTRIAAVVGAVLFAINQLDVVVRGDFTALVLAKSVLTFFVPFCVAMLASLATAHRPG